MGEVGTVKVNVLGSPGVLSLTRPFWRNGKEEGSECGTDVGDGTVVV